jgi:diacylglycerol kinase (ATP)
MTMTAPRTAAPITGRLDLRSAHCVVIANPAAAGVDADVVGEITGRIADVCAAVTTTWTSGPGQAAQLATRHLDADLIIAVGGDGTMTELIQPLVGRADAPVVCPLPVGSGNSTARNLFGDLPWTAVLDFVLAGATEAKRIDLLHIAEAGTTSVLGVSTGFLAQVLVDARHVDASLTGINRYYAAAGAILADMPAEPTRVTVDGVVLADGPLSSVAIGGGQYRARSFKFLPDSILDDGLLDVSTIDALDAAATAELVPLMPAGEHLGRPGVRYARGRRVVVERTDGTPLVAEWDGSVWDAAGSRITVEVVPAALTVLTATEGTSR